MKKSVFRNIVSFITLCIICISCSKSDSGGGGGTTPPPPPPPPPPPSATTCIISGVSQVNSGSKTEYGLTAQYNAGYNATRLLIYDSTKNINRFDVTLNYATNDSVRIDQYQYFKLDASNRIISFVTKSDLTDPIAADDYKFEYIYNNQGYLATKNLYINGGKIANLNTTYTYNNNILTKCLMIAPSSGNLKVLESDLIFDNSVTIKNWIYTFPDAFESYVFSTALNFGIRPSNPLSQVITKIYNPATGILLDTWTTNYNGYKVDTNGYITYGVANGNLQEGIATFYGKTNFYYVCH